MTKEVRHINYKELRDAYLEVKNFVEKETYGKVKSLNTKLVDDLGCSGDDNWELLDKFVTEYKLDARGFDYQKHFHTEYELFGSEAALGNLIRLPIYLSLWLIQILTLGKIKTSEIKINIFQENRVVTDITIGDMVTWYLEKKYKLRGDIKYELTPVA